MKNTINILKELGYYVGDYGQQLVVASKAYYDKELQINILQNSFSIKGYDTKYKIEYFFNQIPVEKEFETIEDLLDFIKEVFPIEG